MKLHFSLLCRTLGLLVTLTLTWGAERSKELSKKYFVHWSVDHVIQTVTFTVTAQTRGYIGFGLSTTGGMANSDVIMGGVHDNGQVYFTDRWAKGKYEPLIDDHQDWVLHEGTENATHTVLRFSRPWDTCDDQDLPITNSTIKFIWAMGATDEINLHDERGTASVNILDSPPPPVDTSSFDIWDVTVNTIIPTTDTTYWCTIHRTPRHRTKQHIVGFKVKLENEGARTHNHHLAFHKCIVPEEMSSTFATFVNQPGASCMDGRLGPLFPYCKSYIYVWAKGGDALFLPENVGFPMNAEGRSEYFLMELHYDNPKVFSGVQYDTGIEVYTSSKLREHDAGLLMIGHDVDSLTLLVPPKQESYVVTGHCSHRCTGQYIDPSGINVINVLLHSHLAGRQLKIRHFRPDEKKEFVELPWLSYDDNYDFDLQENRPLKDPVKILPGDHLTYECTYNTKWRNPPSMTFGGASTRSEMCISYLIYYPMTDFMDICLSERPVEGLLPLFGIQELFVDSKGGEPTQRILKPESLTHLNFSSVLNTKVDWTPELAEELQRKTRFGPHKEICKTYRNRSLQASDYKLSYTTYPTLTQNYELPPRQCATGGANKLAFMSLPFLAIFSLRLYFKL